MNSLHDPPQASINLLSHADTDRPAKNRNFRSNTSSPFIHSLNSLVACRADVCVSLQKRIISVLHSPGNASLRRCELSSQAAHTHPPHPQFHRRSVLHLEPLHPEYVPAMMNAPLKVFVLPHPPFYYCSIHLTWHLLASVKYTSIF